MPRWSEARCLESVHFGVASARELQQLLVRSGLHHLAMFNDHDTIGASNGGESMRDHDCRDTPRQLQEALVDLRFAAHIERGGRLVKDQNASAGGDAEQGARQGKPLPLTARELTAIAQLPTERGLPSLRQTQDEVERPRLMRGLLQ